MVPNRPFQFGEVLELTGVSRSQLIYWTHRGLITAGVRKAQGTGHHRLFSFGDLVAVAVARALARCGVTVPSIRRVLTAIAPAVGAADETSDRLAFLMGDPASPHAVWVGTRDEFVAELQTAFLINQPVGILIDVGRIADTLDTDIGAAG